jgi:hypothetical protein
MWGLAAVSVPRLDPYLIHMLITDVCAPALSVIVDVPSVLVSALCKSNRSVKMMMMIMKIGVYWIVRRHLWLIGHV